MPKESFIQTLQYVHAQQLAEEHKKDIENKLLRCSDHKPGTPGFYRFESQRTLFRKWQENPVPGESCYTIGQYFAVERIPVDVQFRIFFQAYRCFNTFLSEDHALKVKGEVLEFLQGKQYELYGKTQQLDLFEDSIQLVKG